MKVVSVGRFNEPGILNKWTCRIETDSGDFFADLCAPTLKDLMSRLVKREEPINWLPYDVDPEEVG